MSTTRENAIPERLIAWRDEWAKRFANVEDATWHPATMLGFLGIAIAGTFLVRPVSRNDHELISYFGGFFLEAAPIALTATFAVLATLRIRARARIRRELRTHIANSHPSLATDLLCNSADAPYELLQLACDPSIARTREAAAIALEHGLRVPENCYSCMKPDSMLDGLIQTSVEHLRTRVESTRRIHITHRFPVWVCKRCLHQLGAYERARSQRFMTLLAQAACAAWFIVPFRVVEHVWIAGNYGRAWPLHVAWCAIAIATFVATLLLLRVRDVAPTFGLKRATLEPGKNGRFWLHVENLEYAERLKTLNSQ